ncbi:putative solute carrier organic anion transporter family member 1B7 [Papio anubis]|uniref:putative solute carrier organic anion transporter family member 1B7 n=1 Tax=Papio anubis TaxID=9555 RepID=UPI0012AE4E84|nr:putative solute carrier organic anion transporter family member 1B7 [Papio anubis]
MQALSYFSCSIGGPSHIMLSGGILAPIYFGALTDRTCMKWSSNSCGKRASCRIYHSTLFGFQFRNEHSLHHRTLSKI